MNSRIKTIILTIIAALALMLLSGCSLAQPERTAPDGRLVGVLINVVPEDGIDPLTAAADPATGLLEAKTRQRDDKGIISTEYYFDEGAGIPLFCPTMHDENGDLSGVITDERVSGIDQAINESDSSRSVSISGKIFVDESKAKLIVLDPVYQREDGSVYAVPSDDGMLDTSGSGASSYSLSLDEKYNMTENGKKYEKASSVKVDVEPCPVPLTVEVCEMDADNNVVSRQRYDAGEVPDSISTSAEWLLTVTENADGSITREVWDRENYTFTTFAPDGNVMRVCVTEIEWR